MTQPVEQRAAPKALAIPEIIGLIIDAICDQSSWDRHQTLYSCALVNSSWEIEARRRLWEYCGTSSVEFHAPQLVDLTAIKSSRQQGFANNIRCISVGSNYAGHLFGNLNGSPELGWQGQHLTQLQHLSFPRLEKIVLEGPEADELSKHPEIPLKQLVGPRLKKISISATQSVSRLVMSEEWIVNLTKHSRHIEEFLFFCDRGYWLITSPSFLISRVSPTILASFFESMQSLTTLRWEMGGSLSKVVFETLAQMPLLKTLSIPMIPDVWISDVNAFWLEDCFRSLETLECEMSAEVLAKLLPSLHGLKRLHLQARTFGYDTGQEVKTFAGVLPVTLEELTLVPAPCANINAADILEIARATPNLRRLDIARQRCERDYAPSLFGLNDDFIKSLAPLLPKLEEIGLVSNETRTSERCLIDLGHHCPLLRYCTLTARIDFEVLLAMQRLSSTSWPQLKHLSIYNFDINIENRGDESDMELDMDSDIEVWRSCKAVLKAMPKLETAHMESPMLDEFIESVLKDKDTETDEEMSQNELWGFSESDGEMGYGESWDVSELWDVSESDGEMGYTELCDGYSSDEEMGHTEACRDWDGYESDKS